MQKAIALVNEKLTLLSEAAIPLLDRGFLFGHALFETILLKNASPQNWQEHWNRLTKSCLKIYLNLPEEEKLLQMLRKSHSFFVSQFGECPLSQARIIVTGGDSVLLPIQKDSSANLPTSRVIIIYREVSIKDSKLLRQGIRAKSVSDLRSIALRELKTTNYLPNLLALEEAQQQGFDDAVFVNLQQEITELSSSSFLWLNHKNELCTVATKENCLPGTTLNHLRKNLTKLNKTIKIAPLKLANLKEAKICYALSSVRGIVPLSCIDQHIWNVQEFATFTDFLKEVLLT